MKTAMATFLMLLLAVVLAPAGVKATGGDPQVSISQVGGQWMVTINVDGPFNLIVNGQTVDIPAAVAPGGQLAYGSCTLGGVQYNLAWDGKGRRLWMPDFDTLKAGNMAGWSVRCHVKAHAPGTLEALGRQIPLSAGQDWFYDFPIRDPSFGFAFQAN